MWDYFCCELQVRLVSSVYFTYLPFNMPLAHRSSFKPKYKEISVLVKFSEFIILDGPILLHVSEEHCVNHDTRATKAYILVKLRVEKWIILCVARLGSAESSAQPGEASRSNAKYYLCQLPNKRKCTIEFVAMVGDESGRDRFELWKVAGSMRQPEYLAFTNSMWCMSHGAFS